MIFSTIEIHWLLNEFCDGTYPVHRGYYHRNSFTVLLNFVMVLIPFIGVSTIDIHSLFNEFRDGTYPVHRGYYHRNSFAVLLNFVMVLIPLIRAKSLVQGSLQYKAIKKRFTTAYQTTGPQ